MMWMRHSLYLCKMAPCMSGCCVNSGLFDAGMVSLFGEQGRCVGACC